MQKFVPQNLKEKLVEQVAAVLQEQASLDLTLEANIQAPAAAAVQKAIDVRDELLSLCKQIVTVCDIYTEQAAK